MDTHSPPLNSSSPRSFDVVIVGAGISGIDAAYRVQTECPAKSYAVLEARGALGGTWDLFRYPGVRSDSDMHTLGFPFHPWHGKESIAGGDAIRNYVVDTARHFGIDRRIKFDHRLLRASWVWEDARWNLDVQEPDSESPTYVVTRAAQDPLSRWLYRYVPARLASKLTRWKNILYGNVTFYLARRRPLLMKRILLKGVRRELPGYDVDTHGVPVQFNEKLVYKVSMFNGVPNLAMFFGYTNASWTLRCDLTARFVCRVLRYMDRKGWTVCMPDAAESSVVPEPLLDFSSGYVTRGNAVLPRRGQKPPWRVRQNYLLDMAAFAVGSIDDGTLKFSRNG